MAIIFLRNGRADERLENGLCVARNPQADISLMSHINGNRDSQIVSLCLMSSDDARPSSKYFGLTNGWAQGIGYMLYQGLKNNAPFRLMNMHVDLSASNVYDVSTRAKAKAHKLSGQPLNYAPAAREVCVAGVVPAVLVVDQCAWTQNEPTAEELNAARATISEFRHGYGSDDPYVLGANLLLDSLVFALGQENTAASTGILKVVLQRDDIRAMLVK